MFPIIPQYGSYNKKFNITTMIMNSKKKIRSAIILCGGKGTRLGTLGKKIPKTLVKVQQKEILWYIINILKYNGFNHIILPLGYKKNLIKKFLKRNNNFFIDIDCIDTGLDSNIGKRISLVEKKIKSKNFLLLNGDAIFDINFDKIYKRHENRKIDISFLSTEIVYQYGTIGVVNNKIDNFKRDLVYDSLRIRGSVNYKAYNYSGMSIINTAILRTYKKNYVKSKNFEIVFFGRLIKSKKTKLIKAKGFWHSIDNMKDLHVVDKKTKNNQKFNEVKLIKNLINKK